MTDNTDDPRESLRRRMGEAAALPPDDPVRRAVEGDIARAGDWARDEWLDLLREDALMRLDLQRVDVPSGLRERLLELPAELGPPRGRARVLRLSGAAAAAAVLVFVVALGAVVWLRGDTTAAEPLKDVAVLAAHNHSVNQDVAFLTDDAEALEAMLNGAELPFEAELPVLADRGRGPLVLEGGRPCRLGMRPVAYTRWSLRGQEDVKLSLFQFDARDLGLPPDMQAVLLKAPDTVTGGMDCGVLIWCVNGRGYALTGVECERMEGIRPAFE